MSNKEQCQVSVFMIILLFLISAETLGTENESTPILNDRHKQSSETTQNLSGISKIEENTTDQGHSLVVTWKTIDTENETSQKLYNITNISVIPQVKLSASEVLKRKKKAKVRRLPAVNLLSAYNRDLQKELLELNMFFPCGKYDRCRVGRNYCNVDTGRCEICNSDVCHGTNADSMCNYQCKELPSPGGDESSTASPFSTSSTITQTTEGCPTIVQPERQISDQILKILAIILIAVFVIVVFILILYKCHRRERSNTTQIPPDDPENTSRKKTDDVNSRPTNYEERHVTTEMSVTAKDVNITINK